MNGQWIGQYSGSNSGLLVIDIDDMGTHYEGRAFAYDDNPSLPSTFALIKTPDKSDACRLCLDLLPVNPRTGDASTWEQLTALFPPNVIFPRRADVHLVRDKDILRLNWTTDIQTTGAAEIPKSRAGESTDYVPLPDVSNWEQFKAYVTALEPRRYIFRGPTANVFMGFALALLRHVDGSDSRFTERARSGPQYVEPRWRSH